MPDQEPTPNHSELASFGEELRREREIRGISLKEIADATKISKRFLEAIERNDHKTLPAPVFTRGFVREYARYLGLSADEMVNRYNFAAVGDDRIEQSAHLERLTTPQAPPAPRKKAPMISIPPPYARVDRNVYILLIVVIALAGVSYWALKHRRDSRANDEHLSVDTKTETKTARDGKFSSNQTLLRRWLRPMMKEARLWERARSFQKAIDSTLCALFQLRAKLVTAFAHLEEAQTPAVAVNGAKRAPLPTELQAAW